jgi:hypothetical protein
MRLFSFDLTLHTLIIGGFILCAGCAESNSPDNEQISPVGKKEEESMDDENLESIGIATMKEDGTIVLRLRAESDDGAIGEALFTYAPDDEQYDEILTHLGGLEPGESKAVPPWPDD